MLFLPSHREGNYCGSPMRKLVIQAFPIMEFLHLEMLFDLPHRLENFTQPKRFTGPGLPFSLAT